ncbi:MAG: DUF4147 domain-containing protein [Aureliella sp.]
MTLNESLRSDCTAIWQAGVDAVTPVNLFDRKVELSEGVLRIDAVELDLHTTRRLVIVGGGKASAAMASALMNRLEIGGGRELGVEIVGWVNCPEGTFESSFAELRLNHSTEECVRLCAARPPGVNSPTSKAVEGTRRILELVRSCSPADAVISLVSGGGSALLVAPPVELTLEDKQAIAQLVAARGGDIGQLNSLRRCLSEVKAGGLARATKAGNLVSVIISDVLGDPLETIASGPTWLDTPPDPEHALKTLTELDLIAEPRLRRVVDYLRQKVAEESARPKGRIEPPDGRFVQHVVLGNNGDAVSAAEAKASELGYRVQAESATQSEGDVMELAKVASERIKEMEASEDAECWISGGEPTVVLPGLASGKGGRNQQLVVAIASLLVEQGWQENEAARRSIAFLSGGTDGEDGPTDAAGGYADTAVLERAEQLGLKMEDFLGAADTYNFLGPAGGLIKTGSTGTNVCDLRVALCRNATNSR